MNFYFDDDLFVCLFVFYRKWQSFTDIFSSTIIPQEKDGDSLALHLYPFNPYLVYCIGLSSASICFCKRLVCIIFLFFG